MTTFKQKGGTSVFHETIEVPDIPVEKWMNVIIE